MIRTSVSLAAAVTKRAAFISVKVHQPHCGLQSENCAGIDALKEDGSQLRLIGERASKAFVDAMKSVSPTEPEKVFKQVSSHEPLSTLPETF